MRAAWIGLLVLPALAAAAAAQTTAPTIAGGGRDAAGAVVLPSPNAASPTTGPSGATTAGAGQSGSSGAGRNTAPAWVLCPPPGAAGLATSFTGSDLSCAP